MASPKAYSYLRFSTPEQAKGDSFRRQTEAAAKYAAAHKLTLDDTLRLRDEGVSGYSGANVRKGALGQFLAAVDDGEVPVGSYLLVENLDRVSRQNPWDAMAIFQQIINAGVVIVTLHDGKVYTEAGLRENSWKILESLIVMIRANEESATKSRRGRETWRNKRKRATEIKLTAQCPGWLRLREDRKGFDIIEARAAVVRRIFTLAAGGVGQHKIAGTLNAEGVAVFGRGRMWHRTYIAKLLSGDAVIGTYTTGTTEHSDGRKRRNLLEKVADYYPAIVDHDLWATVRSLSQTPRARGRNANNTAVNNVLGGVGRCALCGGTVTLVSKNERDRYLACVKAKNKAGCTFRPVRYGQVEAALVEGVDGWTVAQLDEGSDHPLSGRLRGVRDAIDAHRDELERLSTAPRKGPASATLRDLIGTVEADLVALEAEAGELELTIDAATPARVHKRVEELQAALRSDPLDRRKVNGLMRQLIESAEVNRGTGYVTFQWQHGAETQVMFGWPEASDWHPHPENG